uniref:Putative nucleoprotein n=1 Tax=Atrato Rhabdo-like virus 2 TaxID=2689334 RepID=A0A6B9KGA5_9RHAB|nr:putative nucleoprotein [Atrato Rhabdo-like virus 2]
MGVEGLSNSKWSTNLLPPESKITLSTQECVAWLALVKELIVDKDDKEDIKAFNARIDRGLKLVAYLALNTLRLITKDAYAVADHIQTRTLERLKSLFGVIFLNPIDCRVFCPPHYKFLIEAKDLLNKGTQTSVQIATFIALCWEHAKDDTVKSVWKAGCTLSLSYTGLSAISWFEKAVVRCQTDRKVLLAQVALPTIKRFILEYMKVLQYDYQHWVFCRLMCDTALAKFSAAAMPVATAFFIGLNDPQLSYDDATWQFLSLSRIQTKDIIAGLIMAEIFTQEILVESWDNPLNKDAKTFSDALKLKGKAKFEAMKLRAGASRERGAVTMPAAPAPESIKSYSGENMEA